MRIIEANDSANFVDEFNVVVGFDTAQSCCEFAEWYFTNSEPTKTNINTDELQPDESTLAAYSFDPDWFKEVESGGDRYPELDEGGAVAFRLCAPDCPDLFLVLFNCQNGYYSHGFRAEVGGVVVREGYL